MISDKVGLDTAWPIGPSITGAASRGARAAEITPINDFEMRTHLRAVASLHRHARKLDDRHDIGTAKSAHELEAALQVFTGGLLTESAVRAYDPRAVGRVGEANHEH